MAKILTFGQCGGFLKDYFLTLFSTAGVNFSTHSLALSKSGRKGRNEFCFVKLPAKKFLKNFLWLQFDVSTLAGVKTL